MEILVVAAGGGIVIPPEIVRKWGLSPGDSVALIETARGLFLVKKSIDPKILEWWNCLSDEENLEEARKHEALSEASA
jgi:bifunctional DNA-binding transcriptional regulator/antitoxin component of YhaV-PrlF toxin-antitoxin module